MSNYHSQIRNYGQPQSVFDANTAIQVLGYKQQKYDANAAKIQEALNTYGNIDLARDEDKEYLYNKLNTLVNSIKGMKGADLGSENITSQIMSHVSQAMDERVMKQYGNTQRIRKFEADLQERIKKNPDAWNEANYSFALNEAGYYDYMDPNKDVDDLGQLTYRDYVDVGAEKNNISLNLHKFTDVIKETVPEGFYYRTTTGERLTKEQVRRITEQQLSDKAKGQMEINAWSTYEQDMSPEELNERFERYSKRRLKSIEATISEKKLSLGKASNENEKEELRQDIEQWEEYRDNMKSSFDNASTRAKAVQLYADDFYEGFANTFYKDDRNILTLEYSTNQAAITKAKMEIEAAKRSEDERDDSLITPVLQPYKPEKGINPYEDWIRQSEELDESFRAGVMRELNNLRSFNVENGYELDYAKEIEKSLEGEDVEDKEMFIFNKLKELSKDSPNIVSPNAITNLERTLLQYNDTSEKVKRLREDAWEEEEAGKLKIIYETAISNRRIPIINEEGEKEGMKSFLERQEIYSYEDLEKNEDVKNKVWQQYYADMALSTGFRLENEGEDKEIPVRREVAGRQTMGITEVQRQKNLNKRTRSFYYERLKDLVGEEEAERYLKNAMSKGSYDTNKLQDVSTNLLTVSTLGLINLVNPDNSFEDDVDTRNLISEKSINRIAKRLANEEGEILGRGVDYIVHPDTSAGSTFNMLGDYIASNSTRIMYDEEEYKVDRKEPITIRQVDPDHVELQFFSPTADSKTPGATSTTKKIAISQLPPSVQETIRFEMDKQVINGANFPNITSKVRFHNDSDLAKTHALSMEVLNSPDRNAAKMYSYEGVRHYLFEENKHINGSYDSPTEVGEVMKVLLESKDITVKPYKTRGEVYVRVDKGNYNIFQYETPIEERNMPENYKQMQYLPAIYVVDIMNVIMQEVSRTGSSRTLEKIRTIK